MYSGFSGVKDQERDLEDLREIISKERLPRHVAIIMDGNGRWAQKQGFPRKMGHKRGVKKLKEIVKVVSKLGIEYLTVFAFSTENWKRPKKEVNFLMKLFNRTFENEADELHRQGVRVRVLGRKDELSIDIKDKIDQITEMTADNKVLNLNIALNYGGRAEIVDAAKELATQIKEGNLAIEDITEEEFNKVLYTSELPDPELLIRPSGEKRISNFLLWQLAYTEFWFTSTLWPDFSERELLLAIREYQERERRFGGLEN